MELLLLLLLLARPAAASSSNSNKYHCDWCPRPSTASLFPPKVHKEASSSSEADGAMEVLPDGVHYHAAASADLFRDGGACYQLRCRDRSLCGDDGVKVVVVTEKTTNATGRGFLLTRDAFSAMMARNGSMSDQLAAGLLDNNNLQVQFRRIPCEYKKNLAVRVEDEGSSSRKPTSHLAVRFLYRGGLTDIAAVEVAQLQVGSSFSTPASLSWRSMARHHRKQGVVWRAARAPDGPLQLRLVVTAGSGGKWLRTALPADWRPGGVYDTGLQVTDVAVRACSSSCLAGDDNVDELR